MLALFGLPAKSAMAYVGLLRLGESTAQAIAHEAKLERTTVYKLLEDLEERGLVHKIARGKRLTYQAETPHKLTELVDQQKLQLEQLLPTLLALQGDKKQKPTVRFYEQAAGIRSVLLESLHSKSRLRRDFASVENLVEVVGRRFLHEYIEKRVKQGIHLRSLRCGRDLRKTAEKDWYLKAENADLLREVRYLRMNVTFEPLISVHDHTITIISSKAESYALVIESKEVAQALSVLFDIAWDSVSDVSKRIDNKIS